MRNNNDQKLNTVKGQSENLPEILFITSYPPRECGIATYSHDLISALNNKFSSSFSIKVCALESGDETYSYPVEVKYVLKTSLADSYETLARDINKDEHIKMVLIQHEFGFYIEQELSFRHFLSELLKPVIIVFHTVLPHPDEQLKSKILSIASVCRSIIVMTNNSSEILINNYGIPSEKITVIAHGTHLAPHLSKTLLKTKFGLECRKVLSTFGLLSSGKSIETTLEALPSIIKTHPEVIFLIIGKTHPEVVKWDGEKYRKSLEDKVIQDKLTNNVKFINRYLALPELLEYLQLTDLYLLTSNDPFQAVSGTFAYAMSCACPIISTPIPHAKEVLTEDTGIIFDFCNSQQLANSVLHLLNDEQLRRNMSVNALQKIVSTSWENSAISHILLFKKIVGDEIALLYNLPVLNLDHLKKMTTDFGMIQFSKINSPDPDSGYTLDDNARALITMCMHYRLTDDVKDLLYINKYFLFIKNCLQPDGDFLNYVDKEYRFTDQNKDVNLDDANGRAIWALGFLTTLKRILPFNILSEAGSIILSSMAHLETIHSTRAMAFAIKGLYYFHKTKRTTENINLIKTLADRLVQMYKHESGDKWEWFEGYLTYANSILPESMLYAWLLTGEEIYKDTARSSFLFLLSKTFNENGIEVISHNGWLHKGQEAVHYGEQPIDVAYSIMTLSKFYDVFKEVDYLVKMETAFNWFLGNNRLHQIIYNPCTGGCYDGLEVNHVNLNQGAESTLSYLMARLTVDKYAKANSKPGEQVLNYLAKNSIKEESIQKSQKSKTSVFVNASH